MQEWSAPMFNLRMSWTSTYARAKLPLRRILDDERGATAVEYGLILGGIAIFILVAVFNVGDELDGLFHAVQTKLGNSFS